MTFTQRRLTRSTVLRKPEPDGCSDGPGGEAGGVACDAVSDLEVEDAGGVPVVLNDGVRAGMLGHHRPPVHDYVSLALQDRPHAAGLVGARVRAGLVGRGRGDEGFGIVLGP